MSCKRLPILLLAALLVVPHSIRAADEAAAPASAAPRIQLAILLDTSGSMDGLIAQAQTQLWKIVNEFATTKRDGQQPELEVALYEYGKSTLSADSGWLRQIVPLSTDLDKVSAELFALRTNGGEEYCGKVIQVATNGLEWSKSDQDLKCIFIAGNEAFTQGDVDYRQACQQAIAKGITVSTIFCGNYQEGVSTKWADGAQLADGSYLNIDQNAKAPQIAAPQDKQLAELSNKLNQTYVAYGKKELRNRRKDLQQQQDEAAEKAAPEAAANRALAKAGALYRNSMWDLVDALAEGKVKLEEIPEDELPEEIKKLKPQEREAFLKAKAQERTDIQEQIKQLSEERKAYVAKVRQQQGADEKSTLDTAIIKSVRQQATKKNFEFEKN